MKWECYNRADARGYAGHALERCAITAHSQPTGNVEWLPGWKCSFCGRLFVRASEIAEVDESALMLDGHRLGLWRAPVAWVRDLEVNGQNSNLSITSRSFGWSDVAQAILELEAWADWWQYDTEEEAPFRLGPLAEAAQAHAGARAKGGVGSDHVLLEGAALLRDGWRPRAKRRAK